MFLRFALRHTNEFILMNMSQVIRVEAGVQEAGEDPWSQLYHLPSGQVENGSIQLSVTEVTMTMDEMAMLLSGRWTKSGS